LSPEAHQDRFDPSFIVVNQGDTVRLTFIDNDTVAHDFVLGPPYSIVVNASVPGLVNDLTGQTFTTPAKNNSPGVVVMGAPGDVTATYSFVAKYSGVFEFVCTYHAQIGMIGYLVVLPNLAYSGPTSPGGRPTNQTAAAVVVSIPPDAYNSASGHLYSPDSITVVIGVNNTVKWTNNDTATHTVTANGGSFDSGPIAPGATFTYEFLVPGVYEYHCTYHPWMTGTVTVKS
jgi:plastocyanin